MSIFFLLTYIRKNPFELPEVHTPIHPYTIICSGPSHHVSYAILLIIKLSCVLVYISSPFFPCWPLLSLHFSLVDIIPRAQRTGGYYPWRKAHWWILSLHFSRIGGYYPLFIYFCFSVRRQYFSFCALVGDLNCSVQSFRHAVCS